MRYINSLLLYFTLPWTSFTTAPDTVTPSTTVLDLGVFTDYDLSMQTRPSVAGSLTVLCQSSTICPAVCLPCFNL